MFAKGDAHPGESEIYFNEKESRPCLTNRDPAGGVKHGDPFAASFM